MHSHFDLKKSHFDFRNQVPDVLWLVFCYQQIHLFLFGWFLHWGMQYWRLTEDQSKPHTVHKRMAMAGNCRNCTSSYIWQLQLCSFVTPRTLMLAVARGFWRTFQKIGTNVPTVWSGHFYSPSFLLSSNIDDTEDSQDCKPRIFKPS
jgi:hypothetical protein